MKAKVEIGEMDGGGGGGGGGGGVSCGGRGVHGRCEGRMEEGLLFCSLLTAWAIYIPRSRIIM